MSYQLKYILPVIVLSVMMMMSCKKWTDKPAPDLGLTRKYCNVPQAINYNDSFPGIEDNTTCIYPTGPFAGTYSLQTLYTGAKQIPFSGHRSYSVL